MTNKIAAFIIGIFLINIVFSSCHEEKIWMDQAEITGYDHGLCPCCGGLFIKINEETYRFDRVPEGSNVVITSETIFPVSVNVNWHDFEGACSDTRIVVDELER